MAVKKASRGQIERAERGRARAEGRKAKQNWRVVWYVYTDDMTMKRFSRRMEASRAWYLYGQLRNRPHIPFLELWRGNTCLFGVGRTSRM